MSDIIEIMMQAAIDAAAAINAVYAGSFSARAKADSTPVTDADEQAEAIILDRLAPTGLPVLAEESAASGVVPELGERFFAVDPLDGTKEFIKRNGEFTVNIALVERGRPVIGVILAPATGLAYSGEPTGAFACRIVDGRTTERRAIRVASPQRPRMVASRSHAHPDVLALASALGLSEQISIGSSLKFALLAEGRAELYPRFGATSEWDTAAGQAVLEAAGGAVLTLDGAPLAYGKAEAGYVNPPFVAAADIRLARRAATEMRRIIATGRASEAGAGA